MPPLDMVGSMDDTPSGPTRIGVLLCADNVNHEALRFLVLATNRQQRTFEYEFVPFSRDDPFIAPFFTRQTVNRRNSSSDAVRFSERFGAELTARSDSHGLDELPPPHF